MSAQNVTENQSHLNRHHNHHLNETARYIFIVVGVVEVVCGVFGNLILLATLINRKSLRLRNVHNLFIANLALTDLLIMGYWFPVLVLDLILRSNPLSETHCRANGYIIATLLLVSILSLTGISLNRYLNVCHMHLFTKIVTVRHTFICCILSWIISCIIAMLPLFGVGEYGYSYDLRVCSFRRSYKDNTDDNKALYPATTICIFLSITMCLIGFWNFAIFRHWKLGHLTPHSRYPLKPDSPNISDLSQMSRTPSLKTDRDTTLNTIFKGRKKTQNGNITVPSAHDSSDDESECTPSDKSERSNHQAWGGEQSDNDTKRRQQRNSPHSESPLVTTKYSKSPQIKHVKSTRSSPNQRQTVSAHVLQMRRQAKKDRARERAFVRSLFTVFLLMALSFIPFVVITITHTRFDIIPEVNLISDLFLFLNSSVNWIIYGVMNRSFRRQYVSLLRRLCDTCCVRCGQCQMDRMNDSLSSLSVLSLHHQLDRLDTSSVYENEEFVSIIQTETQIN